MKLAIVGSVSLAGNEEAASRIRELLDRYRPDAVVSGGAVGIDTMAEDEARRRGIPTIIYRPRVLAWNPPAGYGFRARNIDVVTACDRLARIVAHRSKTYGSGWTRDYAAKLGKPTEEYVIGSKEPS